MDRPLLDPRSPEQIREQLRALAASYTPEWRYEGTENDPGAALAELFSSDALFASFGTGGTGRTASAAEIGT